MKKISLYIISVLALSSCSFLELQPEDTYTVAASYKTQSDFQNAIAGVYAAQQSLYEKADCWFRAMILRGDEIRTGVGGSSCPGITTFTDDAKVPILAQGWEHLYRIIYRSNLILDKINDGTFTDANLRKYIKGEAYALRGWAYYTLAWQFGGVPLIDTELTLEETRKVARATKQATLDFAENDFLLAVNLLPEKWGDSDKGRVTRYAAMGGLARLYMFESRIASAKFYLKKIIDSGLYEMEDEYVNCFIDSHDNGKERLWEVQFAGNLSTEGNQFITGMLPEGYNKEGDPNGLQPFNGFSTAPKIGIDFMESYEYGDKRMAVSTVQNLVVNGVKETMYSYIVKYTHYSYKPQKQDDWANNLPIMRYTDVLMLYAECLNEEAYSANGEAMTILNKVRKRAGLASYTPAELANQAQFRDALRAERKVEFAFEGIRWQDLLRWGNVMEAMEAHLAYKDNGAGAYEMKEYHKLFPIPFDELSRYNDRSVMWQNPGY